MSRERRPKQLLRGSTAHHFGAGRSRQGSGQSPPLPHSDVTEGYVLSLKYRYQVKALAESLGLHYLKSKRMRTHELKQWVLNNHPALKEEECSNLPSND